MKMCRGKSFFSFSAKLLLMLCFFQICATTDNKQRCAPSSCGKITNISHPFRLKNDPATCGDPTYELACENNRTVLTLFSGKYYVKSINYKNFTIRLVDPGIKEADCSSTPRYFLSETNFTSERVDGYISVIYLTCSKAVKDDPYYVELPLPCNFNSQSPGHVYVFAGTMTVDRFKPYCRVKLVSLSSAYGFSMSDLHHRYSYEEIHRMLNYGFDVSWLPSACKDACGEKECSYVGATPEFLCPDNQIPLGYYLKSGILPKLLIFLEDFLFGIAKGIGAIIHVEPYNDTIDITGSELAIETGRVTGRYILPPLITEKLIFGPLFIALLIYTCRRRHISMYENIEVFLQGSSLMPIRYSYKEIKKMTENFKDKLGEGGYGCVYKGKLRSGPFVAIKMLGKPKTNGQDFISEVATIGRIHHYNVVRLIGFCVEGSKRALVYEFMSNGSLDRYISSKENQISLTHNQMYEISLGVARGIAYLHQGCDMQILHFDIKPHNILLDENFISKVSDFGLAKLYPIENSIVTLTGARGTIGYMAPELFYKNIGGVSHKADVYSFGMLLMEMASKRRNLNPHADRSSQLFFPFWVYNQLIEEREIEMDEITDDEKINVKKMFIVALWCIQLKPSDRPAMNKVIDMLEGDIDNIEMPPKPSMYPNETIQRDLEVSSSGMESNAATSSGSFLEETTTEPLSLYSE